MLSHEGKESFLTEKCLGGCCKRKFDSTYPIHLNGIISENDFRESIEKINNAIPPSPLDTFSAVVPLLCCAVAPVLCVYGVMAASFSPQAPYFAVIGVGAGCIVCWALSCLFIYKIDKRDSIRLRKAIADESKKCTDRSATPCSWRLSTTRIIPGTNGKQYVSEGSYVSTSMY